MPVVVIAAPALFDEEADLAAASSVAVALAGALSLSPDDVYVTLTRARVAVRGADPVRPWPVVLIHGRRRPAEAEALIATRAAAASAWQVTLDEVWVQWVASAP